MNALLRRLPFLALLALIALLVMAPAPDISDFNPNQFAGGVPGNVSIASGVAISNIQAWANITMQGPIPNISPTAGTAGNALSVGATSLAIPGNGFSSLWNLTNNAGASQKGVNEVLSVNQSGTAGFVGLFANVTEVTTGSGVHELEELDVGGVSKLSVDDAGNLTNAGGHFVAGAVNANSVNSTNTVTAITGFIGSSATFTGTPPLISWPSPNTLVMGGTGGSIVQPSSWAVLFNSIFTNTTSTLNIGNYISSSIQQGGTGGFDMIYVDATESTLGSGEHNLIMLKNTAVPKFWVDDQGNVNAKGAINATTSTYQTNVFGTRKVVSWVPGATSLPIVVNTATPTVSGGAGNFQIVPTATSLGRIGIGTTAAALNQGDCFNVSTDGATALPTNFTSHAEYRVRMTNTTNVRIWCCASDGHPAQFAQDPSTANVEGFRYSTNSPDWFAYCSNASASTAVDTGLAATTTLVTLSYTWTANNQISFFTNGVLATTIGTTLPKNVMGGLQIGVQTLEAVAKDAEFEYAYREDPW